MGLAVEALVELLPHDFNCALGRGEAVMRVHTKNRGLFAEIEGHSSWARGRQVQPVLNEYQSQKKIRVEREVEEEERREGADLSAHTVEPEVLLVLSIQF